MLKELSASEYCLVDTTYLFSFSEEQGRKLQTKFDVIPIFFSLFAIILVWIEETKVGIKWRWKSLPIMATFGPIC
jgi:hypothetical protein